MTRGFLKNGYFDIMFEVCILSKEYKDICRLEVVNVIKAVFGVGIFQFKKPCLAPIHFPMNLDCAFSKKHVYTCSDANC